jgi:hypothetical protein
VTCAIFPPVDLDNDEYNETVSKLKIHTAEEKDPPVLDLMQSMELII